MNFFYKKNFVACRRGREPRAEPRRGTSKAPAGGSGGGAARLPRNELKMFNEQILSRNEAWFAQIDKRDVRALSWFRGQ